MTQTSLHDLAEFHSALTRHPRVMLFKHSPICPVSASAHREWEAFGADRPDAALLFVDVIGDRAVARALAIESGVAHASPQAILFVDGEARWDASHGDVTREALRSAWDAA